VKILGVQRVELDNEAIFVDKKYLYEVTLDTANLSADDLGVELVVAKQIEAGESVKVVATKPLAIKSVEGREVTFSIDYTPASTGSFDVALRVYPKNERLPHRMDFALVKWA
jgi:phosphorylase/glycogen(starch) synthase